jgi:serine protease inhibitor ecotin
MQAPMSDDVRRILANPKAARDFMRQLITGRRQDENAIISVELDGKKYEFQRMGHKAHSRSNN